MATAFYVPTSTGWTRFQFLHIFANACRSVFLTIAFLVGVKLHLIVVLICISFMAHCAIFNRTHYLCFLVDAMFSFASTFCGQHSVGNVPILLSLSWCLVLPSGAYSGANEWRNSGDVSMSAWAVINTDVILGLSLDPYILIITSAFWGQSDHFWRLPPSKLT